MQHMMHDDMYKVEVTYRSAPANKCQIRKEQYAYGPGKQTTHGRCTDLAGGWAIQCLQPHKIQCMVLLL